MMRSMTAGLGVLTILAIAGTMTPAGQAMLGMRPSQTQTPVAVISDPGDASAHLAAPRPVAATPAPVAAPAPAVPRPAPVAAAPAAAPRAPAPHPAAVPQAGSPLPGTPGVTPASSIANILLNLPQVLQQTQVHPDDSQPAVQQVPGQPTNRHGPKGKKHGDGDEIIEH